MRQMWPLGPMNRGTISGAIGMKSWATQKLHKTWQNRSFVAFFQRHNSKEITDVTTMSQSFMPKTSMSHIKKHIMQGIVFQLLWMTSISWMIADQDLLPPGARRTNVALLLGSHRKSELQLQLPDSTSAAPPREAWAFHQTCVPFKHLDPWTPKK